MAFMLNKDEETQLEELRQAVAEAYNDVSEAVDTYNEEVDKIRDKVGTALSEYNKTLAELRDFVDGVANARRDEFDEQSDAWKDEDERDKIEEWISTWEGADLDAATIEFPDELQLDFEDQSEVELPSEP
jgi:hypothetical protein